MPACLDFPITSHWLIYKPVGAVIIDKLLFYRIEVQIAAQTQSNYSAINYSTGSVTV